MVKLYDNDTGEYLGTITEDQLQFLVQDLEEEDLEDHDYYINEPTLEWMEGQRADPELVALLRQILGDRQGFEMRWERAG